LAKSFHLREIYQQHGLKGKRRTYRFYLNLYEYEERVALVSGKDNSPQRSKSKLDQLTNQPLNSQQMVFRHYDYQTGQTSYWYRTNERLIGKCAKPTLIKKNYRLGTRSLQPLNLLQLTQKQVRPGQIHFKKPPPKTYSSDFQEYLLTSLLLFCETAQFIQLPLEQEQVPKEVGCNQNIHSHFKSKPLLFFTFSPPAVPLVLQFLDQLDHLAKQFDTESSADFYL
jgi:hypothetical protein